MGYECGACGKRLAYVGSFRGFGIREKRHARRCLGEGYERLNDKEGGAGRRHSFYGGRSRSRSVSSFFGSLLKSFRSEPEGEETLRDTLGLGDSVIDSMYEADWNSTGEASKSRKATRGRSAERGPERKKKAKPQRPQSAPVLDVSKIVLRTRGNDTPDFGTPQQSTERDFIRSNDAWATSGEQTKLTVVNQITCQPCGGLGSFLAEVAKDKAAAKTLKNTQKSELYRSDASTVATSGSSNDGTDSSRSGESTHRSDREEDLAWRTAGSIGGTLLNTASSSPGAKTKERPNVPSLDFSKLKPPERWQPKRPQSAPVRTPAKALVTMSWESGSSAGSSESDIGVSLLRLQLSTAAAENSSKHLQQVPSRCLPDMAGCTLPEVADDSFDIPNQKAESSNGSTFRSFPIEDDYFEAPAPQQDQQVSATSSEFQGDTVTAAKQDAWPVLLQVAL